MEQGFFLTNQEFMSLKNDIETLKKQVAKLMESPITVEWYTVSQAAKALQRHNCTVRSLCKEGKLTFKQSKRKIEISVKSIQDYILNQTAA